MDEKGGLGIRNWNFSDHAAGIDSNSGVHGRAVLDGSSSVSEHQAAFLKVGAFPIRHAMISEADAESSDMDFAGWLHQRNFISATKASANPLPETQANAEMGLPDIHMVLDAPTDTSQNHEFETKTTKIRKRQPSTKNSNHIASKALRPKQSKTCPSESTANTKGGSLAGAKREKKNQDIDIDRTTLDFSHVPSPICSCTGIPRQCYRWGAGGWQSSCCTTSISEYPLPMSLSRPGARLAGRKMSNGAYGKLLQRLAAEGHDLSNAVDLKNHWARHGTNKFVTIR
ncbi:protein BASIC PENTACYSTEINE7 [Magnolia sinica]|uniref:protein BASIC PENTACYSTEINE7 n=1 Tax=Magnolia sinica TaxID=86752 RepID=UPI00265905F8|nr:protein BASIC PENTACYSTEINE7 [Magnolia sinica]XP_058086690.1 protein BASIC PENTACYSTEINE7 [Magnolia sinica]